MPIAFAVRVAASAFTLAAAAVVALAPAHADELKREKFDDAGFVVLFDGKSLDGWKVSPKTGHSRASKNTTGGKWVVENGAIVGSQDIPGNGGIIMTEKPFANFEVIVEMNNDYGPDSGLFLRSTDTGRAYQAMIDYHGGGNLMGVYGEGLSGGIHVRNFDLLGKPEQIKVKADAAFPLSFKAEDWPKLWKHGEWNELRARIVGNPPKIITWINGVRITEFEDKMKRHPDAGGIALQVHGGGDYTKQFVRYKGVKVKVME